MKISKRITMSVFVVVVVLSFATNAFSWGEVNKAKEFMQAGMYPQAIELLTKRINDKPSDGEAHFQLGVCFIQTGNFSKADERFGSAVRLKPAYGYKIGGPYQKAGTAQLNNGQIQSAINLYKKAVSYQPNLKKIIAQKCYDKAFFYLAPKRMLSSVADQLFAFAIELDPTLAEQALIEKNKYAKAMLNIAKKNWKTNKSRRKSRPYKESQKYLTQTEIDKVVPPPCWKSRPGYPKTFTGKGYKRNDAIIVSMSGINVFYGDKMIITGPEFSTQVNGKKRIKIKKFIYQSSQKGLPYRVRSGSGVKFKVDIQCYK